MKKYLLLTVILLSACMPTKAETRISACPLDGIERVTFYIGSPSDRASLTPQSDEDGGVSWNFGKDAGNIYLVCRYEDENERVQKLPFNMTGCHATYDFFMRTSTGLPQLQDLTCRLDI